MPSHDFLRLALLVLHLIGLAFGLGGATVADFSFFRALKKGDRVTPETVAWMRSFSQIVWLGIFILTVSGGGLFLLDPHKYLASPGFLAKMVVVGVLIINGWLLSFYTTARLTTFNFSEKYQRRDTAWKVRKLSFIFGAISVVSWYSALIIAEFKSYFSLSFYAYIGCYVLALTFAIACSLALEFLLHNKAVSAVNRPKVLTVDQLAGNMPSQAMLTAPAGAASSSLVSNSAPPSPDAYPATPNQPIGSNAMTQAQNPTKQSPIVPLDHSRSQQVPDSTRVRNV